MCVELRGGSRGAFPRRMRAAAGGRWLFVTRALPAERSSRLHDYFFFGKEMLVRKCVLRGVVRFARYPLCKGASRFDGGNRLLRYATG
jgi:hypothetical protein